MTTPPMQQPGTGSRAAEFAEAARDVVERLARHIEEHESGRGAATGYAPFAEIYEALDIDHWIGAAGMNRASFNAFLDRYLEHSVQLHSPSYMAHQVGVPDFPSTLADLVSGTVSNPMALFEMGPSAATIEYAIVNWMLAKVGWTPQPLPGRHGPARHAAGVLTHGGSLANLTALLAARAAIAPEAWQRGTPGDLAILVPDSSHYSIARAAGIMGMGTNAIYALETDRNGVVRPDGLAGALARVRGDGRRCMALVANVCATGTGLHDPLRPIAAFCQDHGIWLHADACHGASALLSPRYCHYLDGIDLADSIVWDAHKMLQVSVLCAAVLFRDVRRCDQTFQQQASYLFYGDNSDSFDCLHRAVECTKASLGLKVFLNLAWRGEAELGQYVTDRYRVTREFFELIHRRPGFECPYEPETNILCFRYGDDDALQLTIRDRLLRERRFHLSSTELNGRRYLRMTVMNRNTDAGTVLALLAAIEDAAMKTARRPG